jgi:hypothetical protein
MVSFEINSPAPTRSRGPRPRRACAKYEHTCNQLFLPWFAPTTEEVFQATEGRALEGQTRAAGRGVRRGPLAQVNMDDARRWLPSPSRSDDAPPTDASRRHRGRLVPPARVAAASAATTAATTTAATTDASDPIGSAPTFAFAAWTRARSRSPRQPRQLAIRSGARVYSTSYGIIIKCYKVGADPGECMLRVHRKTPRANALHFAHILVETSVPPPGVPRLPRGFS